MKSTAELLEFYGVKPGKKYIITDSSSRCFKRYINTGFELKYNPFTKDTDLYFYKDSCCYRIHILNRIDYVEYKEPVLDSTERKYLSAVIKPFRKDVKYIRKNGSCFLSEMEVIVAILKNDDSMIFPYFKKGMMYKGMQINKKYTLEELGL